MRFVAVGHICYDVTADGYIIGGGTAYSAITARNLGADVHVLTAVGPDFQDSADLLHGVRIVNVGSPVTTIFENTYSPSGRVQHVLSAAMPVGVAGSDGVLANADVTYLCPIADEVPPEIVEAVRGGVVGAAPQGWLRRWDGDGLVRSKRWEHAERVLPYVDLLVLSEEDVAPVPDELPRYRSIAQRVVLTRGSRGATLFEGTTSTDFPAYSATQIDPTGAGDVFAAALQLHWALKRDTGEAIEFANCVASFAVEDIGTRGVPTRDQIADRWRSGMPDWDTQP